jgi:flagellar protein FliO/FliZ
VESVDWISFGLSFFLVILLLGATLWGLKRFGRMQIKKSDTASQLRVIDSVSLGARQRIALIEADNQRILVGVTPSAISRLGQWEMPHSPNFQDALKEAESKPAES